MKKVKIVLYVGAALFGVYALVNFFVGFSSYGEYIEYYGLGQVLPTILELFFGSAGWAFLLFGLGAICGHFEKQEAVLEAIDMIEEEEFEMVPEAETVEEDIVEEPAAEEPAAGEPAIDTPAVEKE